MSLFIKDRLRTLVDSNVFLWGQKRKLQKWRAEQRDAKLGKPLWMLAPQDIQIDTHNFCSSTHYMDDHGDLIKAYEGCAFCNVKDGGAFKIPRGRMDDDLLFYIIDYWGGKKHLGVENICPYVNGDVIIDNRTPEIWDASERNGLNNVLDTSGNVYDNREWLIHPNLKYLRFSMSAITPDTYEKVQGCPKFDETMNTIDYVLENKYPSQTVEMHFMVCKYNEHEIEEYVEYFNKEKGLKVKLFPLHEMPTIQLNSEANLPTNPEWINRGDTLQAWEATRPVFIYPNGFRERQVMSKSKTCQGMAYAVQWDGLILHCTDAPPEYNYGTVKADGTGVDMLEAWHMRNRGRINNPSCIMCNAKRPDWWKTLQKYDLATDEEIRQIPILREEILSTS